MSDARIVSFTDADREQPGYLRVGDSQLYYMLHRAAGTRRGGVVIAPPLASERSDSYVCCARWARRVSAAGFDAVRFDYRGIGESTGNFKSLTLDDWRQDIRAVAGFLRERLGSLPLILHGMRLSAVLASDLFTEGLADAMLLWAAPASAQDHLWEVLRFALAAELVQEPGAPRRTREDCLKELEAGGEVNVGGYFWTLPLWRSGLNQLLCVPREEETRPWRSVEVRFKLPKPSAGTSSQPDPHRHQIASGRFWEESQRMTVDIRPLADDALAWFDANFPKGSTA